MDEEAKKHENEMLVSFLKELDEREELQGAAAGIAKKIIDKGVNSITNNQKDVIYRIVENYKKYNTCEQCSNGNVYDLTDYIHIRYEGGLCPQCYNEREQFMNEK